MLLWQVCLTSFLFFLTQTKRNGCKQTTAMSYIIKKTFRANIVSLSKPFLNGQDLEQRWKPISNKQRAQ